MLRVAHIAAPRKVKDACLGADLILLSDVSGILDGKGQRIAEMTLNFRFMWNIRRTVNEIDLR